MSVFTRPSPDAPIASVVISTYNRRDALLQTLAALGCQSLPPHEYEVVVADDGSDDGTYEALKGFRIPCHLSLHRHARNRGISAGRNLAIRNARGSFIICLSDDLLVPADFVASHMSTLTQYPGYWVVGGFKQLAALRETAFGRYLDDLEQSFTEARKAALLAPGIWELSVPTARNLSLPRADLEVTGLFDERFRVTCEDQDLAERAKRAGIRFLYNEAITCIHNDQTADLLRCCRAQRRGTHDTALLCDKYPEVHGYSQFHRAHGYLAFGDGPGVMLRKVLRLLLSGDTAQVLALRLVALAERTRLPETLLRRLYAFMIGLSIFRGWREGLRTIATRQTAPL